MTTPALRRIQVAPFARASALVRRIAGALRPPATISVTDAARKHRVLNNPGGGLSGAWSSDLVPYVCAPQDCLSAFNVCSTVALIGPSQCGKTEVGLNWILHSAIYDPAAFILSQPTKEMTGDFMKQRVGGMIEESPDLAARMKDTPSADNVFSKEFRGGMNLWAIWPVAAQLRQRPAPRGWADDFDEFPEDIDGQGDFVTLIRGRQTTFEGREKTLLTSSPSLGAGRGIEFWFEQGTRRTWRWPCPHCGVYFEADYSTLAFDDKGAPEQAASSAHVVCPANGCIIEPAAKAGMNARGVWAGPQQTVRDDGTVEGPPIVTTIESFRIDGLMGFKSWGSLAAEHRAAEIHFEQTQEETALKAFFNTRAGKNYTPREGSDRPPEAAALKSRADVYALKTVPAGVRFLTAAVDCGGARFDVGVKGWGANGESWWIDRYAIRQTGENEDIAPHRSLDHWDTLMQIFERVYPFADRPGEGLRVAHVCIDTGGLPGVSDNAYSFGARLLSRSVPLWRFSLIKGSSRPTGPKIGAALRKKDDAGRPRLDVPPLFVCNVTAIKDQIALRLNTKAAGPGFVHFPHDFATAYFDELAGERKDAANETFDLEVYNEIAHTKLDPARVADWVSPPEWAKAETIAVAASSGAASSASQGQASPVQSAPRDSWLGPRRNWFGR